MARSRRKNGGPRRGTFKRKKLGKGWLQNRSEPVGNRPVLRITETDDAETAAAAKPASKPAKG